MTMEDNNEYKTCPDCCYDILDDEGDVMDHECISDNEMIAEFMGWDIESPTTIPSNLHLSNLELDNEEVWVYKFHTSWDWLMPVVENIENLGYELIITESRCKINHNTDHSIEEAINIDIIGSKIEATYQAVVEFIKQYNESNKMDTLPTSVQQG